MKALEQRLSTEGLDEAFAEIPHRHMHQEANSAWNFRRAALLLAEASERGQDPVHKLADAIPLLLPEGEGEPRLLRDDAILRVNEAAEILRHAPFPAVLEETRAAAERVQFWHISRQFLFTGQAAGLQSSAHRGVPETITTCIRLLLSQALVHAEQGDLESAYQDLRASLRITGQLTASEVQWQRELGQDLLQWNLPALEYVSTTYGVAANSKLLGQTWRALEQIDLFGEFDTVALRTLLFYEQRLFLEKGDSVPPSLPLAEGETDPAAERAALYLPELKWPKRLLEPPAVHRLAYLRAVETLQNSFREKPLLLAKNGLRDSLPDELRKKHKKILTEFLKPQQQRLLGLERRRRLAAAAVRGYQQIVAQRRLPADFTELLQGLQQEQLVDPDNNSLLQVRNGDSGRKILFFAEATSAEKPAPGDANWMLASDRQLQRLLEAAPAPRNAPVNPDLDRKTYRPGVAKTPLSRKELLRLARELKTEREALRAAIPDPETADEEEKKVFRRKVEDLREKARELREASQSVAD